MRTVGLCANKKLLAQAENYIALSYDVESADRSMSGIGTDEVSMG